MDEVVKRLNEAVGTARWNEKIKLLDGEFDRWNVWWDEETARRNEIIDLIMEELARRDIEGSQWLKEYDQWLIKQKFENEQLKKFRDEEKGWPKKNVGAA